MSLNMRDTHQQTFLRTQKNSSEFRQVRRIFFRKDQFFALVLGFFAQKH